MTRIWAKIITNQKIKKDLIYTSPEICDADSFGSHVAEICHQLDIPTPVILKSNIKNFEEFNNTRFRRGDFVESVEFDFFALEDATEREKATAYRPKVYDEE